MPNLHNLFDDNTVHVLNKTTTTQADPYYQQSPELTLSACVNRQGFLVDLLDRVAQIADFQYEWRLVQDGHYGAALENDQWSGMIGEVQRGVS